jgi:hypothetical protein
MEILTMRIILLATFLINFLPYTAHAIDVGGIINTDTTWTLTNSPYIVTENVVVSEGITLAIEPRIEVKFETEKVEKGPIEAVWKKGGEDTTARGDRVIWGHFYASPSDMTWGSQNNPYLFVKI